MDFLNTNGKTSRLSLSLNTSTGVGQELCIDSLPKNLHLYEQSDLQISENTLTVPEMYLKTEFSNIFRNLCIREETEISFILSIPIKKTELEQKILSSNNPIYPFGNMKLYNIVVFNTPDIWYEKDNQTFVSGRINFKSYTGIVKLYLDNDFSCDIHELEVVSYKIDYEEDFKKLLGDLAQFNSELILSLDAPAEITMNSSTASEETPQSLLLHLKHLMQDYSLPLYMETILSNPYSKEVYLDEIVDIDQAYNTDLVDLVYNSQRLEWRKGGNLSSLFRGYSPLKLPQQMISSTYDTLENQYIKFCLQELEQILIDLRSNINNKLINSLYFINKSLGQIQEYLQNPFFKKVGSLKTLTNSTILQKRIGYKEFAEAIYFFNLGIQLESDINEFDSMNGDLRPIYDLYEYWCFFTLLRIHKDICSNENIDMNSLLKYDGQRLKLILKKGLQSKVDFKFKSLSISLFYNKNFVQNNSNTWSGNYASGVLHPDFSIRITSNSEQEHWLHFDSKYKLDKRKLTNQLQYTDGDANYVKDDIKTAHAYRDAILGTRGVYILYPDYTTDKIVFIRNPNKNYRENFPIPSIGAFPLRPSVHTKEQINTLKSFLIDVYECIAQKSFSYNDEAALLIQD
jgi:predicted component of viral defense system (DUF524 family)